MPPSPLCTERPVTELLVSVTTRHPGLQSADNNALLFPRMSLMFGERAFSVAGPAAWDTVPIDIQTQAAPQLSRRNSRLFFFINLWHFSTLGFYRFSILSFSIFVSGLVSAAVSLYCHLRLHHRSSTLVSVCLVKFILHTLWLSGLKSDEVFAICPLWRRGVIICRTFHFAR